MNYPITVGLDVHLSKISAAAFYTETAEVKERTFRGDDTSSLIEWINSLGKNVSAVYESGFCGFTLKRSLDSAGITCSVAATSKLLRPAGDKIKTDRRDAIFLARQLACKNIVPVHVPSIEREGMRDLSRALGIARENLTATKLRVMQAHHRYGLRPEGDMTKGAWTLKWLSWAKSVAMPSLGAQMAYEHHLAQALRLMDEKKHLEKVIAVWCEDPSIKAKVDALMTIKGISKTVAFCLIAEIGLFSRFKKACGFSSFLGLVPSESSSGKSVLRGNITRTGNEHARRALIEASWCYARMKTFYKKPSPGLSVDIVSFAHKANRRLFEKRERLAKVKKPCVANAAVVRELSCWVWQIATQVEKEEALVR